MPVCFVFFLNVQIMVLELYLIEVQQGEMNKENSIEYQQMMQINSNLDLMRDLWLHRLHTVAQPVGIIAEEKGAVSRAQQQAKLQRSFLLLQQGL